MSYNIIPTYRFEKELKRLTKKFPSLKNEFAKLIADISANPETGSSLAQVFRFSGSLCLFILPDCIGN